MDTVTYLPGLLHFYNLIHLSYGNGGSDFGIRILDFGFSAKESAIANPQTGIDKVL